MQIQLEIPTFEEWKRQDSTYSRILAQWKPSSTFPFHAPFEAGNIIDYLRFLGAHLENGNTIPEYVLDALQPGELYLLLTTFAPHDTLSYYSPERFRYGRA